MVVKCCNTMITLFAVSAPKRLNSLINILFYLFYVTDSAVFVLNEENNILEVFIFSFLLWHSWRKLAEFGVEFGVALRTLDCLILEVRVHFFLTLLGKFLLIESIMCDFPIIFLFLSLFSQCFIRPAITSLIIAFEILVKRLLLLLNH